MKIHCPKCHTCYSVETGLIPIEGKKFRCSCCGEVWFCTHKDFNIPDSPEELEEEIEETSEDDTKKEENPKIAPQNVIANEQDELLITPAPQEETSSADDSSINKDEMSMIFERLKNETSKIDTEIKQLPLLKKILPQIKKYLGWNSRLTIFIELLTATFILSLAVFSGRYELVRRIPQLENLFTDIGLPARVIGEGLEFQNITRHYMEDDQRHNILSIKGFIFNTTDKELNIPTIAINILDENADSLHIIKKEIESKTIKAKDKTPFTLLVEISPEQAKYILLTFSE